VTTDAVAAESDSIIGDVVPRPERPVQAVGITVPPEGLLVFVPATAFWM
jgi:hypothetical protein